MLAKYLLIILLACEAQRCHMSYIKHWMRNDNYDEAGNWVEGEVPCSNQRAVFPAEIEGAVMLPAEASGISGMVLPISGELLLPSDGEITVTAESNQNESCPSGDKHFRRSKRWYWIDPNNWELMPSSEDKESWYSFPDIEKLPCQFDIAAFDGPSTYEVEMPDVLGYSISGIQINSYDMRGTTWSRFLRSEVGSRMFRRPENSTLGFISPINVYKAHCIAPSGCICHQRATVRAWLMEHMRNIVACPTPKCVHPIQPIGNVCDICGAVLMFDFENRDNFILSDFRKSLARLVKEAAQSGTVIAYASKVTDNLDPIATRVKQLLQIVLTDGIDYGERSIRIASELESKIKNGNFGLRPISTLRSGHYYDPDGPYTAPWIVLATLLAVCLMLAVVYYVYVGPKSRLSFGLNINRPQFGIPNILPAAARRSFLFARFDNTSNDGGAVDLAACVPSASEHSVASSLCDMEDTFDNAAYSPNLLQEAGERAVATFSELKRREQEEMLKQEDLMAMDDIEE